MKMFHIHVYSVAHAMLCMYVPACDPRLVCALMPTLIKTKSISPSLSLCTSRSPSLLLQFQPWAPSVTPRSISCSKTPPRKPRPRSYKPRSSIFTSSAVKIHVKVEDACGHLVQLAREQQGSRYIQQQLESGDHTTRELIFQELLPSLNSLMGDMFGNYVVQKFLECGSPEQRFAVVERLQGQVLSLTLQMYGCRVIQKALETLPPEQQV